MRSQQHAFESYLDFRAALREVLRNGDPHVFRLFLRDSGEDLDDPDLSAMGRWREEALLPIMHRMICADTQLSDQHAASRAWLRQHDMAMRVSPTGYGWSTELRERYRRKAAPRA